MSDDTQIVQVRMKSHTINQLDRLKAMTNAPSRSDAIRRAMDIAEVMADTIIKGGTVITEASNGKQQRILITGINA